MLPSGVCGAVLATSGPGTPAYAADGTTPANSPPTTAAAATPAAICIARRPGRPAARSCRSSRTDASSGSVPLRSAISRSAVRGAN
ncbi:hypothetical protein [Streptomyces sp. NRRL S-350]|uniref:hypothetical protein n=1 Tax=Streptomyces sp. NRRL S-350 TaxID=1463902 RepID=UPI001F225474|nr:hypothetical protein [Streptomyces sp. NRRL S-350]